MEFSPGESASAEEGWAQVVVSDFATRVSIVSEDRQMGMEQDAGSED